MKVLQLNSLASLLLLRVSASTGADVNVLRQRDPCTPLASGWESIDDSPAINAALVACGAGGTIVLPADQLYSIRTPIDFSPCKKCEVQIEGYLLAARGQWDYWRSVDSIFTLANVHGVRIRSLTGQGVVDGNAIETYLTRSDSGMAQTKTFAHITNGSSDVVFENLTFKNVMQRFFRAEGNSTRVSFSNLTLTMEQNWGGYPRNQQDAVGIELGYVTDVHVSDIYMHFQATTDGPVGICIAIDLGTHDVDVRGLTCKGTWGGALITLGSISGIFQALPSPDVIVDAVSNIYIANSTIELGHASNDNNANSAEVATGFRSFGYNTTMSNITWDGITVVKGSPAEMELCWLKCHCWTGYYRSCRTERPLASSVSNIWFKNFRGNVGPTPGDGPGWGAPTNLTTTDVHFEGWVYGPGSA